MPKLHLERSIDCTATCKNNNNNNNKMSRKENIILETEILWELAHYHCGDFKSIQINNFHRNFTFDTTHHNNNAHKKSIVNIIKSNKVLFCSSLLMFFTLLLLSIHLLIYFSVSSKEKKRVKLINEYRMFDFRYFST